MRIHRCEVKGRVGSVRDSCRRRHRHPGDVLRYIADCTCSNAVAPMHRRGMRCARTTIPFFFRDFSWPAGFTPSRSRVVPESRGQVPTEQLRVKETPGALRPHAHVNRCRDPGTASDAARFSAPPPLCLPAFHGRKNVASPLASAPRLFFMPLQGCVDRSERRFWRNTYSQVTIDISTTCRYDGNGTFGSWAIQCGAISPERRPLVGRGARFLRSAIVGATANEELIRTRHFPLKTCQIRHKH